MKEEWLPAGLELVLALDSVIDDKQTVAGDAVEAVLVSPARDSEHRIVLPTGARFSGIVTQLASVYRPVEHRTLRIEMRKASVGGKTYALRAIHKAAASDLKEAKLIYGSSYAVPLKLEAERRR